MQRRTLDVIIGGWVGQKHNVTFALSLGYGRLPLLTLKIQYVNFEVQKLSLALVNNLLFIKFRSSKQYPVQVYLKIDNKKMKFERIVTITNAVKCLQNYNHWVKFGDFSKSLSTAYFSQILFVIGIIEFRFLPTGILLT